VERERGRAFFRRGLGLFACLGVVCGCGVWGGTLFLMPVTPCKEPGCGEWAEVRGRCRDHFREYDGQRRGSLGGGVLRAGHGLYRTKRWRLVRRRVLRRDEECQMCHDELAAVVDHIVAVADGGDPWDEENLQGLCWACHGVKTREEQMGRGG
jgi:5-methylcytosine-specific restriction protein A